ncbi:MAG: alpha/beta fold hydrolase [Rhodospirillales bacterium]
MSARTPLVLLPGLLCDGALWRHQTDTLADIAGITVADLTGDDCLEDMARSVLETAPETFALAGLSMGGYVAQAVMRHAPDRVTRLALLDTSARADTPEQSENRRAFIEQTRHGDFKGVTSRLLPMLIHADRLEDGDLTGTIMAMAERVGKEAFLRQQNAIMNRPDGRRDLGAIHCPALVLCGREDALTPLAGHQEMAAGLPNSKLVVIEDCGHMAPLERPRAVSAVMRYWLQA